MAAIVGVSMQTKTSRCSAKCTHAGVTVIELLVTLSIMVILLTVALPGFSELMAETRRVASVNQLVGALNMARSEAIKRGVRVTLCKSADPDATTPACAPGAAWNQGWLVFVDNTHVAGNLLGVIDGTDQLLRVVAPTAGLMITAGSHYARGLFYEANGVIWGINSGGNRTVGNDTFRLTSNDVRLCVTVNLIGRPSVRKQGQDAC